MKPEPKFVPGELVEIAQSEFFPHVVGSKFVVVDCQYLLAYTSSDRKKIISAWCYELDDGLPKEIMGCKSRWIEYQLRKLPPDTPATFDAAIWQPCKVTA